MTTLTWRERVALSQLYPRNFFAVGRKRIVFRMYMALVERGLANIFHGNNNVVVFVITDDGTAAYRTDNLQRESDRICGGSDVIL
jgi:hypothetical protein